MEEPPRVERVISSKHISCRDAAEFAKRFLQDFGTYLEEEVDEDNIDDLSTDVALASGLEDMGPQSHAHDNLVNFVEYHLGSGSSGVKRIVEKKTNGGEKAILGKESADNVVKSEDISNQADTNGKNPSPKEIRKLKKAKEKELKRQEKKKKKEMKQQEKKKKKKAEKARKKAEKKEKRRRSKGGDEGDGAGPASKKIKSED